MRLGQIFVESGFITQSELSAALAYAETKEMKIGRCLVLLRMINDVQLNLALEAQNHMRRGLDTQVGVDLFKIAMKDNTPFSKILGRSQEVEVTDYLERSAAATPAAAAAINSMPTGAFARSGIPGSLLEKNKAVAALLRAGDDFVRQQLYSEAEDSYRSAIGKLRLESVPADVELVLAMGKLIEALQAQNKNAEVGEIVELILYIGNKNINAEGTKLGKAVTDVADTLGTIGRGDLALTLYLFAGRVFEQKLPSTLVDAICCLRAASVISKSLPDQVGRKRLGELFVAAELVNDVQIKQALAYAKQKDMPLGSAFEELKLIGGREVKSVVYCQMLIQQNILTEPVAIQALRLAWRQDMDLKTFLAGANIPPAKENTPIDKELCETLDNLLGLEAKQQGKSLEAATLLLRIGQLYVMAEAMFDAEFAFRRSYNIFQTLARNSTELLLASLGLVDALIIQNRRTEAHSLLLKTMTAIPSSPSPELVRFFDRLSLMEYEQGSTASAFSVARSALAVMDQLSLNDAQLRFAILETLVKCADEMGDSQGHINYLNQLLAAAQRIPDLSPAALETIQKKIVVG